MPAVETTSTHVRPMASKDVDAVVKLQLAFLEGSRVTELGEGFLQQFHRVALTHDSVRALVATDAGASSWVSFRHRQTSMPLTAMSLGRWRYGSGRRCFTRAVGGWYRNLCDTPLPLVNPSPPFMPSFFFSLSTPLPGAARLAGS